MRDGHAHVFMGMGGNFLLADPRHRGYGGGPARLPPDGARLTKPNRSHLVTAARR